MEATYTFETSVTLPTVTRCKNPRIDLTSTINRRESLKSVIIMNFSSFSYCLPQTFSFKYVFMLTIFVP
jgi:hypothetical protein